MPKLSCAHPAWSSLLRQIVLGSQLPPPSPTLCGPWSWMSQAGIWASQGQFVQGFPPASPTLDNGVAPGASSDGLLKKQMRAC